MDYELEQFISASEKLKVLAITSNGTGELMTEVNFQETSPEYRKNRMQNLHKKYPFEKFTWKFRARL